MCRSYITFFIIGTVYLSYVVLVVAQTQTKEQRCYHFTWLGPRYDNESMFMNSTCLDATKLSSGVPCREPLVVSMNRTWPDVEYIWENYKQQATCIPAPNDICAKYTYYFNGHVENSTYMCTRAVDTLGQAITKGCYEQRVGSHLTRACFCTSIEGAMPCNNANVTAKVSITMLLAAIIVALKGTNLANSVT